MSDRHGFIGYILNCILTLGVGLMCSSAAGQWAIVLNDSDCTFNSVFFVSDSIGFVSGFCGDEDVILRTTNAGQDWTVVYSEVGTYFYDIDFPTDSVGYVAGFGNVLRTVDMGSTWEYPNPDANDYYFRSVVFEDEQVGFGCFADGGAAFGKTIDGGYSWDQELTYGGREILKVGDCQIRMISSNYRKSSNCWMDFESELLDIGQRSVLNFDFSGDFILGCGVGTNTTTLENFGFVASSIDEGQSWETIDWYEIFVLRSLVTSEDGIAYCVGQPFYPNPMSFLKSIDGGLTWGYQDYEFPCDGCFSPDVRDIYCPSQDTCYAVSAGGTVFRTTNGGGETIPLVINDLKKTTELLFSPNPVSTTFVVTIPQELHGLKIVSIIDIYGRKVFSGSFYNQSIKLHLSNLSSGIYSLFVENGETIISSSFVKQ